MLRQTERVRECVLNTRFYQAKTLSLSAPDLTFTWPLGGWEGRKGRRNERQRKRFLGRLGGLRAGSNRMG